MDRISVDTLRTWLADGHELALLDAREQGVYFTSHLFHAANLPLSQLELQLEELVPRRSTRIVWCDDGGSAEGPGGSAVAEGPTDGHGSLALEAAHRAAEAGWVNCSVLDGGTRAWAEAGGELYSGVNVPSKAFGELVEHTFGTPHLSADELKARLDTNDNVVVLDSRPLDEYRRMSIPGATDCPGAELVHRVKEVVSDPSTLVVVNCAGRTRSIIGAQSLINAGLENPVVALENGTMGWQLAGYEPDHGHENHAPDPGPDASRWARSAAAEVGRRFGVSEISPATLAQWRTDAARTTYVFDVRTGAEYEAGHLAGSAHAPGGQLVQATDEYAATRNARIVLVDDDGVRATMTASWLRQLGWTEAVVLAGGISSVGDGPLVTGKQARPDLARVSVPTVRPPELARWLGLTPTGVVIDDSGTDGTTDGDGTERSSSDAAADGSPTDDAADGLVVLDLGTSVKYRNRGHIPGAWWGVRSRLGQARAAIGPARRVVLTSTDGALARLAVAEAERHWPDAEVLALAAGNKGWRHAGYEMEDGFTRPTTEPDDVWYKPYDHPEAVRRHMEEYLTWEVALVDQLRRDPTVSFPTFT